MASSNKNDNKWKPPKNEEEADKLWISYKLEYKKEYKSDDEEKSRKEIFIKRLHEFEEHNNKYEQGLVTYTMGVNQFTDKIPGDKCC